VLFSDISQGRLISTSSILEDIHRRDWSFSDQPLGDNANFSVITMEDIAIPREVLIMEVVPNLSLYDLYHLTSDKDLLLEELQRRQDTSLEYYNAIDNDDPDFLRWLLLMKVPYPSTDDGEGLDKLILKVQDRCLLVLLEDLSADELKDSCMYEVDTNRLFELLLKSEKAIRNVPLEYILSEMTGLADFELECQLLDKMIAIQGYIPRSFFGDSIRISVYNLPEDPNRKQYIKKFAEYIDYIK